MSAIEHPSQTQKLEELRNKKLPEAAVIDVPPPLPPYSGPSDTSTVGSHYPETSHLIYKDAGLNQKRGLFGKKEWLRNERPERRRRRRVICWIVWIIIALVVLISIVFGVNQARCSALQADDSKPLVKTTFTLPKSGIELLFDPDGWFMSKTALRFHQSDGATGRIEMRVAGYTNDVPAQQTSTDTFRFGFSPFVAPSWFNLFSVSPVCFAVSADIYLPVGNLPSLVVTAADGPMEFDSTISSVYDKVDISTHDGSVLITGNAPGKAVSIASHNGQLKMDKFNNPNANVSATAHNGMMTLTDVTSGSLTADNHNGMTFITRAVVTTLSSTSNNGMATLTDITAISMDVVNHNGMAIITNSKAGTLTAKSNNGKIAIDRSVASTIRADGDNGEIDIKIADVTEKMDIKLSGKNGRVGLTMPSTYKGTFSVRTQNGRAEVNGAGLTFDSGNSDNIQSGYKSDPNAGSSISLLANNGKASLQFL